MTNFLYEMQDELDNLIISVGFDELKVIRKLIDHIENQGKTLRHLNAAITDKNETITGLRHTIASLNDDKANLLEKIDELNNGIRDSEDLSWKEKYDLAIKEKECTVNALQNKCKSLENQIAAKDIAIESVERTRDYLREKIKKLERANLDQGDTIGWYVEDFKKLKEENEKLKSANGLYVDDLKMLEKRCREAEKKLGKGKTPSNYIQLELVCHKLDEEKKTIEKNFAYEMQVNKDLNETINSKNDLLDKYAHSYAEEIKMKEQFKAACFKHETTIANQKATIAGLKEKLVSIGQLANEINNVLTSKE